METKNNEEYITKHISLVDYGTRFLVPPHSPGGGGLALYWKTEVNLTIQASCDNYIEVAISYKGKTFKTTFVYGEPDHSKRRKIWEAITENHIDKEVPWFLTGDFNDILDHDEKSGGPERPEGTFGDFRTFFSQGDLYDLPHSGNPLSWRGVRYSHLVHCRLDRAISNGLWAEAFPRSRSYYLEFEGSDHRPLLSILETNLKRKRGIFRYDRSLIDNEEVIKLVKEAWNSSVTSSVEHKITNCRRAISKWNKEHHINSQKIINEEKRKLELAMSSSSIDQGEILTINHNLSSAYQKEEE
ncbi:unnamed protein product [Microthlaspi erraticum]|uniref:Endonuclease/exonuclease/phosphatase domain-containing protein n=1 Tax=Microthlaspi erraticum TaxID=1685480 RepID=A0A6D2J4V6_9BRAS|nr:unnamed protein product [Microthlaspi erraticum]